MRDHSVFGPNGKTVDVPLTRKTFPREGFGKVLRSSQVFNQTRHLSNGCDVATQNSAGNKRMSNRLKILPRRKHVQHNPVDTCLGHAKQFLGKISYA